MIKIIVATPKGELINKNVESIVVSGDTGQIGILMNRLPLLMKITKGFIKISSSEIEYIAILSGVIDFKDNVATVIAHNAEIADNVDAAFKKIEENLEKIQKLNRQKNIDFVGAEKELMKNIKEIGAAHLE